LNDEANLMTTTTAVRRKKEREREKKSGAASAPAPCSETYLSDNAEASRVSRINNLLEELRQFESISNSLHQCDLLLHQARALLIAVEMIVRRIVRVDPSVIY